MSRRVGLHLNACEHGVIMVTSRRSQTSEEAPIDDYEVEDGAEDYDNVPVSLIPLQVSEIRSRRSPPARTRFRNCYFSPIQCALGAAYVSGQ